MFPISTSLTQRWDNHKFSMKHQTKTETPLDANFFQSFPIESAQKLVNITKIIIYYIFSTIFLITGSDKEFTPIAKLIILTSMWAGITFIDKNCWQYLSLNLWEEISVEDCDFLFHTYHLHSCWQHSSSHMTMGIPLSQINKLS